MVTALILLFSVTMLPGGLRDCLLVLRTQRKTQTRYYFMPLDILTRLSLGFSGPQIIGVCDILFNEDYRNQSIIAWNGFLFFLK
jgi:hypothetical protein